MHYFTVVELFVLIIAVMLDGNSSTMLCLQEVSKKDRALDAKGGSNTKDIRIENFDVAFGER